MRPSVLYFTRIVSHFVPYRFASFIYAILGVFSFFFLSFRFCYLLPVTSHPQPLFPMSGKKRKKDNVHVDSEPNFTAGSESHMDPDSPAVDPSPSTSHALART